jgi:ferredoxin
VRATGISVNFDCCVGDCGSCAVKVLEGEPEHRDHVLSDAAKARGRMCLCVSRAKSEKLVLDL